MKVNAQNAAAVRRKAAAETPLILRKESEITKTQEVWVPELRRMAETESIYEKWNVCTTCYSGGGRLQITTTNRRMESKLEQVRRQQPEACKLLLRRYGVTIWEMDSKAWSEWAAQYTVQPCNAKEATTEGGPEYDAN